MCIGAYLGSTVYARRGKPTWLPRQTVIDILTYRMNHTQLMHAAIFDLLTTQSDRHAQVGLARPAGTRMCSYSDGFLQCCHAACMHLGT